MKNLNKILLLSIVTFSLGMGCGGSSSSPTSTTTTTTSEATTAFPSGLAATSPFDVSSTSAKGGSITGASYALSSGSSTFDSISSQISSLLTATSSSSCTFDPTLFSTIVTDAACYGPEVTYQGHPDATSSSSSGYNGTLPTGDTGLWSELNTDGNACAVAEMNSRMEGVKSRSKAALSGLATIICVINNTSTLSLPASSTTTVTSDMPVISGVTYNNVTLTHEAPTSGGDKYSYVLDFTYNSKTTVVNMTHIPGSSSTAYEGTISWRVNGTETGGNCSGTSTGTDITRNGSFVYSYTSSSALALEVREAEFCGSDVNGLDSSGVVNASDKLNTTTNTDGWGNNFDIFTASFSPSTLVGNYVYSWQAGPQDSNTRVFNVAVTEDSDSATNDMSGTAFFGFGNDIAATDPRNIKGFICNWAGPNFNHTTYLQSLVQKQVVDYNTSTSLFGSTSANITYAPTNSCDYDGAGSFTYDSNGDGTINTTASTAVTNNLVSVTDGDSDGVFDEITTAGFTAPSQPTCSGC